MYKPPVEVVLQMKKLMESMDDVIVGKIMSSAEFVDITVDKEELRKALLYDRDQYNIGRNDAAIDMFTVLEQIRKEINIDIEDSDENTEGLKLVLEYLDEIEEKFVDI